MSLAVKSVNKFRYAAICQPPLFMRNINQVRYSLNGA